MAYDHGAFRVKNLKDSIQFYTEKLGFKFLFQHDNQTHGEKYAFLEYNGARLELIETVGRTYTPTMPEHPFCPHLCFRTDDIDGVLETLSKNNIAIIDGPNEIPGKEKWFYFTDPDYNVLECIIWYE